MATDPTQEMKSKLMLWYNGPVMRGLAVKNKKLIYGFSVVTAFVLVVACLFFFLNKAKVQEGGGLEQADSMILSVPVVEYREPGNVLSEPIIKGYDEELVEMGEEFIIDPASLGYLSGNDVGDIKLRLVGISSDSVTVDVLEDERLDGGFYPREEVERKEIRTGSCIDAFPLVMDVYYEYCFEVSRDDSRVELKYNIESRSTMPLP